jgi:hypothetical protein
MECIGVIIMSLDQILPSIVHTYFTFRHSSDAALFSPPQSVPQPQQNNGT